MTKKLIWVVAILLSAHAVSQAQDFEDGFEQWKPNDAGAEMPLGWSGSNFGTGKVTGAYEGEYAASVWNWYSYVLGILSIGEKAPLPLELNHAGVPIDFIPTRLTGFYRYTQGYNNYDGPQEDSAVVYILLKRYNGEAQGGIDTVGFAAHFFPENESWQPFSIDIPRGTPGLIPDSIAIVFYSSNPDDIARCGPDSMDCSYLSVDALKLVAASGVTRNVQSLAAPLTVVPNPVVADASFRFEGTPGESYSLRIYDGVGRLALERRFTGSHPDLNGTELPAGTYHVSITDENFVQVASGGFVVE